MEMKGMACWGGGSVKGFGGICKVGEFECKIRNQIGIGMWPVG